MRLAESHIMEDVIKRDVPTKTVVLPLVGSVSRGAIGSVSRGAPATGGESSDVTGQGQYPSEQSPVCLLVGRLYFPPTLASSPKNLFGKHTPARSCLTQMS